MDKNGNKFLDFIKTRQSIRKYGNEPITDEELNEILECGRWTPSGLNNQPWKVIISQDVDLKIQVSKWTHYGDIITNADAIIIVFLDQEKGYNRVKDIQAIGAFMENLLLGAHALGLGAVWLGEILNQKENLYEFFKIKEEKFELMGVIAMGERGEELKDFKERERRSLKEFVETM